MELANPGRAAKQSVSKTNSTTLRMVLLQPLGSKHGGTLHFVNHPIGPAEALFPRVCVQATAHQRKVLGRGPADSPSSCFWGLSRLASKQSMMLKVSRLVRRGDELLHL